MIRNLEATIGGRNANPGNPILSRGPDTATQTIDLDNLWTSSVALSGSYDLREIESTSLGKLLDALPIPAFVVDQRHSVVFANRACSKLNEDCAVEQGGSFVDLVSRPHDPLRAQGVIEKTKSVLSRAFETRKPHRAETILEICQKRIWCRLHFRSVRLGSVRQMLVLVEDLTSERIQQRLNKREEERLRGTIRHLDGQVRELSARLEAANEKLLQERAAHAKTKKLVQALET
jgi:PAS domain-containing protein